MYAFVRALVNWGFVNLQNWRMNAAAVVRRIQIGVIITGAILFGIALEANWSEAYWINGTLAIIWPIIIAILATMATSIIATIGLAVISEELLEKYKAFCWGAALFGSLTFATLTVVPMGENPARAGLILIGLVLTGLGLKVFPNWVPKYYEKYVGVMIVVTLTVGVVGLLSPAQRINLFRVDPFAYFHVPKDKDLAVRALQQLERNREKVAGGVQEQLYADARAEKSLSDDDLRRVVAASNGEVVVNDRFVERVDPLKSQILGIDREYAIREFRSGFDGDSEKLCGFEPGKKYRFEVKGGLSVWQKDLGSDTVPLTGKPGDAQGEATPGPESRMWALMIGDTLPGHGEFKADERGCEPAVVINISKGYRAYWKLSGAQKILVTFYGGLRL